MQLKQIIQLMAECHVAQTTDLVGVPLADIHTLEKQFERRFPATYIQFLHLCGRSAGRLAGWASLYFDDLKEIAEEFEFQRCLVQSTLLLPINAHLIGQHDSHFDYFLCDGNDDPEVYRISFVEEGLHCMRFASSFTSYLENLTRFASNNAMSFEPFYIDDCGEMHNENLSLTLPIHE